MVIWTGVLSSVILGAGCRKSLILGFRRSRLALVSFGSLFAFLSFFSTISSVPFLTLLASQPTFTLVAFVSLVALWDQGQNQQSFQAGSVTRIAAASTGISRAAGPVMIG